VHICAFCLGFCPAVHRPARAHGFRFRAAPRGLCLMHALCEHQRRSAAAAGVVAGSRAAVRGAARRVQTSNRRSGLRPRPTLADGQGSPSDHRARAPRALAAER